MPTLLDQLLPLSRLTVGVLQLAVLVVGVVGCLWTAEALRDRQRRRTHLLLASLVVVAWAVRALAPASPHDVNLRVMFPGVESVRFMAYYGLGMLGWTGAWSHVLPERHAVLFELQAIAAALTLLPLWTVLGRVGVSERARVWVLLAWATQPVLVRYGHTDNQTIPALLFFLLGLEATGRWASQQRMRDALVAGLAVGLAVQFRPANLVLGLVALSAVPVLAPAMPWRSRGTWAALATAAALSVAHVGNMVYRAFFHDKGDQLASSWSWAAQWAEGGAFEGPALHGLQHWIVFDPFYTHPVLSAAVVVGAVAGRASRPVRIWLVVWMLLLGLNGMAWSPAGGIFLVARHQLLSLAVAPVLMGLGLERVVHAFAAPPLRLLGAVAAFAAFTAGLQVAWRPTAETEEYRFLAASLPHVPRGCVVYHVRGNRGLGPVDWLSRELELRHRWLAVNGADESSRGEPLVAGGPDDPQAGAACRLYYRLADCFTRPEGEVAQDDLRHDTVAFSTPASLQGACATFESQTDLTPLATFEVPNLTYGYAPYADGTLQVGWFRMGSTTP